MRSTLLAPPAVVLEAPTNPPKLCGSRWMATISVFGVVGWWRFSEGVLNDCDGAQAPSNRPMASARVGHRAATPLFSPAAMRLRGQPGRRFAGLLQPLLPAHV